MALLSSQQTLESHFPFIQGVDEMCQSGSWEVSRLKHVDMSAANLLTSLLIVLISYMPCISNQDYMSTEKKKQLAEWTVHESINISFLAKKSIFFIRHYQSFLFFRICMSYFYTRKTSSNYQSSQKNKSSA